MVAHVVPLRRLDPGHDWFDYVVPAALPIYPGSLVEIPFQSRLILGVVWKLSEVSEHTKLKPIQRLVVPQPIMSEWQRRACGEVARLHAVSVASMVYSVVPSQWPAKFIPTMPDHKISDSSARTKSPEPETLWYGNRTAAEKWAVDWLGRSEIGAILTPTIEDAEKLYQLTLPAGLAVALVTSRLTPAQYRKVYAAVLGGTITHVIGTSRALLLPYPDPPVWLLDQAEHPSHKLRQQYPALSMPASLEKIGGMISRTTPAPSVSVYAKEKLSPPTTVQSHRLWSLQQRRPDAWITPELSELITATDQAPVALIAPARGFARAILCRDCGWAVQCSTCGQAAGLMKADQRHARCVVCQSQVDFPPTCPSCRGVHWHYVGLGLNRFAHTLHQHWPERRISTSWPPISNSNVLVGTYQAYRWLHHMPKLAAIVVVSGDALRAWPDFSADERAWQYLARLSASRPDVQVAVQTHAPDDVFWQRWLHQDHQAWYTHELKIRQQLSLPPASQLWIAEHPLAGLIEAQKILRTQLNKYPGITLIELPAAIPKNKIRLALSGTRATFEKLDPTELFPLPWRIDTTADSWLQ